MAGIVDISEAEDGQGFDVRVDWVGFDEGESSRKSLATIWDGIPHFVNSELIAVAINQLDKLTLARWLIGTTIKVSRGFESQAESFFRKTLEILNALV